MTKFSEDARYDYPLTKDSIVIDAGGYHGDFSQRIWDKYQPRILCFDPIEEYYEFLSDRLFLGLRLKHALGGQHGWTIFVKRNDSSGEFNWAKGDPTEKVWVEDIAQVLRFLAAPIDLLKLNIEGMEYEVFERLLETDLAKQVRAIQVQWHSLAADHPERRLKISTALSKTHDQTWEPNDVNWESWVLR